GERHYRRARDGSGWTWLRHPDACSLRGRSAGEATRARAACVVDPTCRSLGDISRTAAHAAANSRVHRHARASDRRALRRPVPPARSFALSNARYDARMTQIKTPGVRLIMRPGVHPDQVVGKKVPPPPVDSVVRESGLIDEPNASVRL